MVQIMVSADWARSQFWTNDILILLTLMLYSTSLRSCIPSSFQRDQLLGYIYICIYIYLYIMFQRRNGLIISFCTRQYHIDIVQQYVQDDNKNIKARHCWAFVRAIQWRPVDTPHKGPVMWKASLIWMSDSVPVFIDQSNFLTFDRFRYGRCDYQSTG